MAQDQQVDHQLAHQPAGQNIDAHAQAEQLQPASPLQTLQRLRTFLESRSDKYMDIFFSHQSDALSYLDKMIKLAQQGRFSCNKKSKMVRGHRVVVAALSLQGQNGHMLNFSPTA